MKQIIAYLDIIGFSNLLKNQSQTAIDFIETLNIKITNKYTDTKIIKSSNQKDLNHEYIIDSFKYFVNISDSIIIIADENNQDKFIDQLTYLIAKIQTEHLKSFNKPFNDINDKNEVNNKNILDCLLQPHNAFPCLLKGGIAIGEDITIFDRNNCIINYQLKPLTFNITGKTYLEAVELEENKKEKGPRIFCNENFKNNIKNPKILTMFRKVKSKEDTNKNLYEILWTIKTLEISQIIPKSEKEKWEIVKKNANEMIIPVVNILNFYKKQKVKENILNQYKEFIKLIYRGLLVYVTNECNSFQEETKKQISTDLKEKNLDIILEDIME